jgi:hypothetical protein
MKLKLIAILSLSFNVSVFAAENTSYQTGDIIFQSSENPTNKAIELATHSKFSHVGVVLNVQGELQVLEAANPVVSLTPLKQFVQRGTGGYYEVLRLNQAEDFLTAEKQQALYAAGQAWLSKPYDFAFSWNDEELYCSELVYKLFAQILQLNLAQPKALKTFDLSHSLVNEQLKLKYGDHIPYDDNMISPQQIYESELLKTIPHNNNLTGNL